MDAVYSSLIIRAFISSCLFAGRRVYTCGPALTSDSLPVRVQIESPAIESSAQIAWRYNSIDPVENSLTNCKHSFDFAIKISDQILRENRIPPDNLQSKSISEIVTRIADFSDCIIAVSGMDRLETSLSKCQVVYLLKSLTRRFPTSIVLVTWSPHHVDRVVRRQVHDVVDAVFQMDSFATPSIAYPNFEGLFKVHKLPKVNTMNVMKKIETLDLGFQTKRNNRFIEIDKLSLPPDLSETVSRSTCSSSSGNKSMNF